MKNECRPTTKKKQNLLFVADFESTHERKEGKTR
jgi:hypothetical protein